MTVRREEAVLAFDLRDESLTAEAKLDTIVKFLQDSAKGSASWPKMDHDERKRLIDASERLERWVSYIKSPFKFPDTRDALFLEVMNALVAAFEIGMYASVTESAGVYFKTKRAAENQARGMQAREQKVIERRQYMVQQKSLIMERNPTLPQEELIEKIRERWDHPGKVPSTSTLTKDFAALNKDQIASN